MGFFGAMGRAMKAPLKPLAGGMNRAAQPINRGMGQLGLSAGNAVGGMLGQKGPKVGLGPSPNVMPQMSPPPALNTSMPPPPAENQQDISQIYTPQATPQTGDLPESPDQAVQRNQALATQMAQGPTMSQAPPVGQMAGLGPRPDVMARQMRRRPQAQMTREY
jgi:hypothetical protein